MRSRIENINCQPLHFFTSANSIGTNLGDPSEAEDLKKIVEGGGFLRRRGVRRAIHENILSDGCYTVFFEHSGSDDQRRAEKHLQAMGHENNSNKKN